MQTITLFYFSPLIFSFPHPFTLALQRARERNRTRRRTATIRQRSRGWSLPTCSGAPCWPSSRRTSGRPKRCSSLSRSSWASNSPPLATSSWTPAAGAWTNGQTTEPALAANLQRQALVPKRDNRERGGEWGVREGVGVLGRDGGRGLRFRPVEAWRKTKLFTLFVCLVLFWGFFLLLSRVTNWERGCSLPRLVLAKPPFANSSYIH